MTDPKFTKARINAFRYGLFRGLLAATVVFLAMAALAAVAVVTDPLNIANPVIVREEICVPIYDTKFCVTDYDLVPYFPAVVFAVVFYTGLFMLLGMLIVWLLEGRTARRYVQDLADAEVLRLNEKSEP